MNNRVSDVKVIRRRGVSLLSYGLLTGLIAVVALLAVTSSGSSVNSLFGRVGGALESVSGTGQQAETVSISAISPSAGLPNTATSVTISGEGFATTGVVTVSFGGTAGSSVVVSSSSSLTVTTPDSLGAGSVDVVVTNPDGSLATDVSGFSFTTPEGTGFCANSPPLLSEAGCDPGDGTIFAGFRFTGAADLSDGVPSGAPIYTMPASNDLNNTQRSWNDHTTSWRNTELPDCDSGGATNSITCFDGQANTEALSPGADGLQYDSSTAGGTVSGLQPWNTSGMSRHEASDWCDCLGEEHADAPNADVPPACVSRNAPTRAYDGGGHDDWYLPSMAELDALYIALISPNDADNPVQNIGNPSSGGNTSPSAEDGPYTGQFPRSSFWSSSEEDNTAAGMFATWTGEHQLNGRSKDTRRRMICIRQ